MTAWTPRDLTGLTLTNEYVRLRPVRPTDAQTIITAMQDRSMHTFLPLPDPYLSDDAHSYIARSGLNRHAGTALESAIEERSSGRMVGTAGLYLPAGRMTWAEIGYAVYPHGRGHGYAAEATRLLCAWAFENGIDRVELVVDPANTASVRTALAAGFRFETLSRSRITRPLGDGAVFTRTPGDAPGPIAPAFPRLPERSDGDFALCDSVVTLRQMTPDDVDTVSAELDDPQSRRWALGAPVDARAAAAGVTARAQLDWVTGGHARMIVQDCTTGAGAGVISVFRFGPPQVGLIGYGILPAFRGRGFTARALRLLTPWAFERAGFARLELGAAAANVASQKAALAGGFVHEATHRGRLRLPDGSFSDEVSFAVLNPAAVQASSRNSP